MLLAHKTMVKRLDTPESQKGNQPLDLIRGDILPASIFLGIAAVRLFYYKFIGISIGMSYN